jgi:hypothetical protein
VQLVLLADVHGAGGVCCVLVHVERAGVRGVHGSGAGFRFIMFLGTVARLKLRIEGQTSKELHDQGTINI